MLTLSLAEASHFLKLHPQEVSRRARRGLLPGAKVGRRWVFIESDLADYLRSLYARPSPSAVAVISTGGTSCLSTSAKRPGGSTSPLQAASALERLLGQVTGTRRRNSTTA